jgi:hypothetical protein
MSNLSEHVKAFYQAYIEESYLDPHQKFAELTNLPRDEAKQLCYRIMYSFNSSVFYQVYEGKLEVEVTKNYLK